MVNGERMELLRMSQDGLRRRPKEDCWQSRSGLGGTRSFILRRQKKYRRSKITVTSYDMIQPSSRASTSSFQTPSFCVDANLVERCRIWRLIEHSLGSSRSEKYIPRKMDLELDTPPCSGPALRRPTQEF